MIQSAIHMIGGFHGHHGRIALYVGPDPYGKNKGQSGRPVNAKEIASGVAWYIFTLHDLVKPEILYKLDFIDYSRFCNMKKHKPLKEFTMSDVSEFVFKERIGAFGKIKPRTFNFG